MDLHPTITTEITRFFVLSAPHAIVCTIATLMLLGEKVRPLLPKIVLYGSLAAIATIITFVTMPELVALKIFLNGAAYFLFLKLVFGWNWKDTSIRFVLIFLVITLLIEVVGMAVSFPLSDMDYENIAFNFTNLAIVYWPAFVVTLLLCWLARRSGLLVLPVIRRLKAAYYNPGARRVYAALVIMYIALMLLAWNFVILIDWQKSSMFEYWLMWLLTATIMFSSLYAIYVNSLIAEERIMDYAEETISDNVMQLVRTVRSQRHDFVNHIMVLQGLAGRQDIEAINQYLGSLTGSVRQVNDVLKTGNIFIGALLNAKMARAEAQGIAFDVRINADLAGYASRSMDLVRILGNLINNAFDALETQGGERYIRVEVLQQGPLVHYTVANSGGIEAGLQDVIYDPGFTTKSGQHEGLGLYIVRQLVEKLGGTLRLAVEEGPETRFSFAIPRA